MPDSQSSIKALEVGPVGAPVWREDQTALPPHSNRKKMPLRIRCLVTSITSYHSSFIGSPEFFVPNAPHAPYEFALEAFALV